MYINDVDGIDNNDMLNAESKCCEYDISSLQLFILCVFTSNNYAAHSFERRIINEFEKCREREHETLERAFNKLNVITTSLSHPNDSAV